MFGHGSGELEFGEDGAFSHAQISQSAALGLAVLPAVAEDMKLKIIFNSTSILTLHRAAGNDQSHSQL